MIIETREGRATEFKDLSLFAVVTCKPASLPVHAKLTLWTRAPSILVIQSLASFLPYIMYMYTSFTCDLLLYVKCLDGEDTQTGAGVRKGGVCLPGTFTFLSSEQWEGIQVFSSFKVKLHVPCVVWSHHEALAAGHMHTHTHEAARQLMTPDQSILRINFACRPSSLIRHQDLLTSPFPASQSDAFAIHKTF